MTTAGATVKGGFYLNRDAWDLVAVNGKEGILPGADGQRYVKLPVWAVLALAPMLGGLFVVFLPLVGFALVFMHFGRLSMGGVKRTLQGLVGIVVPSWRPGEAYFAGKNRKADRPATKPETDEKPGD